MLYECKIYDGEGNLKKIISPEKVAKEYWKKRGVGKFNIDPQKKVTPEGKEYMTRPYFEYL